MARRAFVYLASVMTFVLVLQSVTAPMIMAQEPPVNETDSTVTTEATAESEGDAETGDTGESSEGEPTEESPIEEEPVEEAPVEEEPAEEVAPEPIYIVLSEFVPANQATCDSGPVLNEQGLLEVQGVASVEVLGDVVAGNTVTVKVVLEDGFALNEVDSIGWTIVDGGTAAETVVVLDAAPAEDICNPESEEVPAEIDEESTPEGDSEPVDEEETNGTSGEGDEESTPEGDSEPEEVDEAESTPDTTSVTLAEIANVCTDDAELEFTGLEATEGVASVSVSEDGTTITVEFAEGYTLDTEASTGWTLNDDGQAMFTLPECPSVGISPMSISSAGITAATIAPNELADVNDTVRLDFNWSATGNPTLQENDSFIFTIDNYAALGYGEVTVDDPIYLASDAATCEDGICGYVIIDANGNATAVLDDSVNGKNFAEGTFWFQTDPGWAVDLQETEDTTLNFDVTSGDNTFDMPVTIPGNDEEPPPVPDPGTEPAKSGRFTTGDQGRNNTDGAIEWTMRAPAGPAAGAELTDTFIAEDGFGTWAFNCDTFTYTELNTDGVEVDVECVDGTITVTFGEYGDGTPPGIRITADVTDSNNEPLPEDGSLTFKNTVTSRVWKLDTDPETDEPFGTGTASAELEQSGVPGPGDGAYEPTKYGSWIAFQDSTGSLTTDAPSRFRWVVRAPAGPADGTVLTDVAPEGWVFDCSTVRYLAPSYPAGGPVNEGNDIVCDQATNTITATFSAYMGPQTPPGFEVDAYQTAEQPANLRTSKSAHSADICQRSHFRDDSVSIGNRRSYGPRFC